MDANLPSCKQQRLNEETLNNEFNIPILDDKERLLALIISVVIIMYLW